ncbi:hypothetical protein ABW20_dc0103080 [Dactylellina cionopaga]|nr:hypothetical protein ABW20_dc0103080 [Dactylellina cionopaga]
MVSTRNKGRSDIVMLNDHGQSVKQSSGKPINQSPKKKSRPLKRKADENTQQTANKRPTRAAGNHIYSPGPSTKKEIVDAFELPSSDGNTQTKTRAGKKAKRPAALSQKGVTKVAKKGTTLQKPNYPTEEAELKEARETAIRSETEAVITNSEINGQEVGNEYKETSVLDSSTSADANGKGRKLRKGRSKGSNHGDIDDETDDDEENLREEMTLKIFKEKFKSRAHQMEEELTTVYDNLSHHRASIDRRLKAMKLVIMDDIEEFNYDGMYSDVFLNHRGHHLSYQPLPAVLPGDPFPPNSAEFDENHPDVQALFPTDARRNYEAGVFERHAKNINSSLEAANSLLKSAEKIFLAAKGYKSTLEHQLKFVETCKSQAKTVKARYLKNRMAERDRVLKAMSEKERIAQKAALEVAARRQLYNASQAASSLHSINDRKRKLEPSEVIDSVRQKRRHEDYAQTNRTYDHGDDHDLMDTADVDYDTPVPDIRSPPAPSTPERVVIPAFGNHTPGRTRRYKQPGGTDDELLERTEDGILIDNRPWTEEENSCLDMALSQIMTVPGRWLDIKEQFGRPGQPLCNRSATELQERAQTCRTLILNSGLTLPPHWDNIEW